MNAHTADVHVSAVIDDAAFSRTAAVSAILLFLVVVIDGIDITMLSYLAPAIVEEMALSKPALGLLQMVTPLGALVGALAGGHLGDRFGRYALILASVFLFGVMSGATAIAGNYETLLVVRLIAGIGLGAATPNAIALLSELLPKLYRSPVMGLALIGFPLGSTASSVLVAALLEPIGWRGVFIVGAVVPLILTAVLYFFLSESPKFLAKRGRSAELASLCNALTNSTRFHQGQNFIVHEGVLKRSGVMALLSRSMRRDTLCLWLLLFADLFGATTIIYWTTIILTSSGIDLVSATETLIYANIAGVCGVIASGFATRAFGSRITLIFLASAALISAAMLFLVFSQPELFPVETAALVRLAGFVFLGLGFTGIQLGYYPLATYIYPTAIRATGLGWVSGVGRAGAISAAAIGAALFVAATPATFFFAQAVAAFVMLICLVSMKQHVPALRHAEVRQHA